MKNLEDRKKQLRQTKHAVALYAAYIAVGFQFCCFAVVPTYLTYLTLSKPRCTVPFRFLF